MTGLRRKLTVAFLAAGLPLAGWSLGMGLAQAPGTSVAMAQSTTQPSEGKEKHPEIHSALRGLHAARHHLEKAAHDFGGHRVEAIKAIDEAIKQLKIALEYDKE